MMKIVGSGAASQIGNGGPGPLDQGGTAYFGRCDPDVGVVIGLVQAFVGS